MFKFEGFFSFLTASTPLAHLLHFPARLDLGGCRMQLHSDLVDATHLRQIDLQTHTRPQSCGSKAALGRGECYVHVSPWTGLDFRSGTFPDVQPRRARSRPRSLRRRTRPARCAPCTQTPRSPRAASSPPLQQSKRFRAIHLHSRMRRRAGKQRAKPFVKFSDTQACNLLNRPWREYMLKLFR